MFKAIQETVESLVNDNWTETTVKWDNEAFEHDVDEYIYPVILHGGGQNTSFNGGEKRETQTGVVAIQVIVRKGVGTQRAHRIAKLVGKMFRTDTGLLLVEAGELEAGETAQRGKLLFRAAHMERAGEGGEHFQENVIVPYEAQAWVPAGATTVQGVAWHHDAGAPGAGLGAADDFYVDEDTGNLYRAS